MCVGERGVVRREEEGWRDGVVVEGGGEGRIRCVQQTNTTSLTSDTPVHLLSAALDPLASEHVAKVDQMGVKDRMFFSDFSSDSCTQPR